MTKKRKPRWAKKHLTNAQVVAKFIEAFNTLQESTCSCPFCALGRRVRRERKS